MTTNLAPGFHVAVGRSADAAAYDDWVGRWSRLFVPAVLAAVEIAPGNRVLDVSTGTGEAALMALPLLGASGLVIGADIAPAMLQSARARLTDARFWPVAADGQLLPFKDGAFDTAICQLGLQFFPNPGLGVAEFRRVLRDGGRVGICVISTPDRAPTWGILGDVLGRLVPERRDVLDLSFALAEANRLENLLAAAGFRAVRVERLQREDSIASFEEYWRPIESGMGLMPQVYLTLPEVERRRVRDEVKDRLSRFEVGGRLVMSVEMLVGTGRA